MNPLADVYQQDLACQSMEAVYVAAADALRTVTARRIQSLSDYANNLGLVGSDTAVIRASLERDADGIADPAVITRWTSLIRGLR